MGMEFWFHWGKNTAINQPGVNQSTKNCEKKDKSYTKNFKSRRTDKRSNKFGRDV